jgi:hypothetical protein
MTIPRNLSFLADGASSSGVLAVTNGATTVNGFFEWQWTADAEL